MRSSPTTQETNRRCGEKVRLENCDPEAILPNSLIANQRGRVTLLRLSRLPKEVPSTI
jgi:hypothetical protein